MTRMGTNFLRVGRDRWARRDPPVASACSTARPAVTPYLYDRRKTEEIWA
jgi:hypothetical protein